MDQHYFIDNNKCAILLEDVDNGGRLNKCVKEGVYGKNLWGKSILQWVKNYFWEIKHCRKPSSPRHKNNKWTKTPNNKVFNAKEKKSGNNL